MEAQNHHPRSARPALFDRRRQPRFKCEVGITVTSKISGVLEGKTADISETGISALLRIEVGLGELVELEFVLPFGAVKIYAVVRHRDAFRYGFQFMESNFIEEVIRPTCRQLAMERDLYGGSAK